ncbi:hypothetical protein COCSUDRAFT_59316 [Coccomyxa subellipsoidea C-169]|uniref:Ubiquitin-like domain-containing protein n=1 Tax=Coccomyxa subellipsoidea (strain C-169) TaxID=574566 RepID=I0Z839_COCSC|nr:hypothetical protein COCSUDRAFT_59316 [Coccomyxa subellipsoidea C-169]EIE26808.1 hypothetical protein COCSUDRAFT_59316 [Coccomyxa subellipsoidea C-169]|eukprot:XP_005651352.1 hypothetical protein COCSUDRAFT_59316 [Coccomyxa subellipsoidea C-169]
MKRARGEQACEEPNPAGSRPRQDALGFQMPAFDLPVCAVAEHTSGIAVPREDAELQGRTVEDPIALSERRNDSGSHCEGSCDHSCEEEAEEEGCSGCADYRLQERQLEEQRRLMAALHSRNCMLTALNSNLIMQLNLLRSIVPVERRESRSLHLRIALPGEYAVEPVQPSKEGRVAEEDTPSTGPMLHIWVNSDMAVEAVRQSMHNFVTAPMGQDWFLSLMKDGAQIEDAQTPESLHLGDGHLIYASLGSEQTAAA